MDIGERLALIIMYLFMAGAVVLTLRLFAGALLTLRSGRRQRQRLPQSDSRGPYRFSVLAGKRGWANRWLPRNVDLSAPSQSREPKDKSGDVIKQTVAVASLFLIAGSILTVTAQQTTSRDNSLAALKEQLIDVQAKETWLRMRLEEIDEQLKPESTDRALAGIGSTRPEELREHRRKLLTIERNGLQSQLDLLEEDRARLLAAIADAETEAYLKSAQPSPIPPEPKLMMEPLKRNVMCYMVEIYDRL